MIPPDNAPVADLCEHSPWSSRRLWSLWDIMKRFHADLVMRHMWMFGDMQIYSRLKSASRLGGKDLFPKHKDGIVRELELIKALCADLDLDATASTAERMLTLTTTARRYAEFGDLAHELESRLLDQLKKRFCFSLSLSEAEYYAKPREGWEKIIDRFPATATDIEEARKCFALARYAAAVFHSVQIVETGLIDLGKIVGVIDPLSGWTATTKALKKIIDAGHSGRTPFQQKHFAFFEQIHGTIEGLKNAWRNKVSHAQGKLTLLTSDFSPEVAEEILFATRAFMRRLATDVPSSEERSS